mgnify:CR=1 FL=1
MKFIFAPRPFWLNLIILVGIVTLIGFIWFLFTRNVSALSNTFFLGAFVLWLVAVVPAFGEMGSNIKIHIDARKEKKDALTMLREAEQKYQEGGRITYLFGLSGLICFILALASLALE